MEESKSIKSFKKRLINTIPCVPNTKASRESLENQHLISVLFHYLHWASRLIPLRPRKVFITEALTKEPTWIAQGEDIAQIISKAKSGDDLNEHLSNDVLSQGYSPDSEISRQKNRWLCKDQLLNMQGFHHLHLKAGKSGKGKLLLLIKITRYEFHIIGLFTHDIFDKDSSEFNKMNKAINSWSREYQDNFITMSGHPVHIKQMACEYWNVIEQIDGQLQNREFLERQFSNHRDKLHSKFKLRWEIYGVDLGLFESKSSRLSIIRLGHI